MISSMLSGEWPVMLPISSRLMPASWLSVTQV
jgi:hypothetical protein